MGTRCGCGQRPGGRRVLESSHRRFSWPKPLISGGLDADATVDIEAGATTLAGFRSYVVERAETRVGVLLNLSTLGLTSMRELSSLAYADVDRAARAIEENRDIVFGIKVRMTRDIEGGKDLEALRLARQLAGDASVPLMVHIGVANSPVGRFLDELRSGGGCRDPQLSRSRQHPRCVGPRVARSARSPAARHPFRYRPRRRELFFRYRGARSRAGLSPRHHLERYPFRKLRRAGLRSGDDAFQVPASWYVARVDDRLRYVDAGGDFLFLRTSRYAPRGSHGRRRDLRARRGSLRAHGFWRRDTHRRAQVGSRYDGERWRGLRTGVIGASTTDSLPSALHVRFP